MSAATEKAASIAFAICVLACTLTLCATIAALGWLVSGTWL
jgi:hypothetical protein